MEPGRGMGTKARVCVWSRWSWCDGNSLIDRMARHCSGTWCRRPRWMRAVALVAAVAVVVGAAVRVAVRARAAVARGMGRSGGRIGRQWTSQGQQAEQEEQMHRDYDRRAYATLAELQKYEALTSKMNSTALDGLRDAPPRCASDDA